MSVRVAILDDSQHAAWGSADWSRLSDRGVELQVFDRPFSGEEAAATALQGFDVIVPMRERTPFPGSLIGRLGRLKLIALTGARAPTLDLAACTARGVLVANTGGAGEVNAAAAEMTWALILAASRALTQADRLIRDGGWHEGLPLGDALEGRTLGVVGLGKLGQRVARYAKAFGMDVVAWSQNLEAAAAAAHQVRAVSKAELFAVSDIVSLHLVLSERTRGVVGAGEIEAMRPGALLVNTARGPLVDEAALVAALQAGRIRAALDVFAAEPLPGDHPLRSCPNTVLAPHLGYSTQAVFQRFYGDSVENILAWLDGAPIRVMNPEALSTPASP